MKKKLSEEVITNELKGRSGFFSPQAPPLQSAPQSSIDAPIGRVRTPAQVNTRTDEQVNARTGEHPKVASEKRVIKRQSYNVYQDQHQALQRLEANSVLSGRGVFISEMVREALEEYLQKAR